MAELKRVSFKVAKAIKGAGYPQEWYDCEYYYTKNGELKRCDDYLGNTVEDIGSYQKYAIPCPYVMQVWLWLWREKKECINIMTDIHGDCRSICNNGDVTPKYTDPEEAIIAAIEYLANNDLIK